MKNNRFLFILFLIPTFGLLAQDTNNESDRIGELKGGILIQKTQKLYWENGFALDFTSPKILDSRVHLGLSYATSRLGSALNSNAIKQDNFLFSMAYYFRHHKQFQPFTRVNLGYFLADYEDPIFDVLPNSAFMNSIDAGLSYCFNAPLTVNLSLGYNLNTGNGTTGPGTLFPVFYQMRIYYTLSKN